MRIVAIDNFSSEIAKSFLSPAERKVWQSFSNQEKEADWLAGRISVKQALCAYLKRHTRESIPFHKIEIKSPGRRKPEYFIQGDGLNHWNQILDISISHSHGMGAGAVSEIATEGLVGVDIERIQLFSSEMQNGFLTEEERVSFKNLSAADLEETQTLLWCLKEAYLKAKGAGLLKHPRKIRVEFAANKKNIKIYEDGELMSAKASWRKISKKYIVAKVNITTV